MATYLQGVSDYIPQIQPFQPDYNFLGNMLQQKQTQYDSNYKQLSKTYGALLNSPMLRDENISQREEFFKTIDQDLKRISGMDLSLQQNVDQANRVFSSFYENKDMVNDMVWTKNYQNQLETAENYRNCLDQEKCGGKYWEPGINALHYKAEEFKFATKEDARNFGQVRYTPGVNIVEKAMKYTKELLGKDFGVESVNWSKDGKYIITTKNGQNLTLPLEQLLSTQFGSDQNIQDMFQTKAYVERKAYTKERAKILGSEVAAENEYLSTMQGVIREARANQQKALEDSNKSRNFKKAVERKIEKEGSTGNDELSAALTAAGISNAVAEKNSEQVGKVGDILDSLSDQSLDLKTRLQRLDAIKANALMSNEFKNTAITVSALTGSTSVKEDPYAKSYYDFSLDMAKMKTQHGYNMEAAEAKDIRDLYKWQAKKEYELRGSAISDENDPKQVEVVTGAVTSNEDVLGETQAFIDTENLTKKEASEKFVSTYTNYLKALADPSNKNISNEEKEVARNTLSTIYGKAYNKNQNNFTLPDGSTTDDYTAFFIGDNITDVYNRASEQAGTNKALHSDFINKEGVKYQQSIATADELIKVSSKAFAENNISVMKHGISTRAVDAEDLVKWTNLFSPTGKIKNIAEYTRDYAAKGLGTADDAQDSYEDMNEVYVNLYNSGNPGAKSPDGKSVPVVKPLFGTPALSMMGGGKVAQGLQYDWNTSSPASTGMRGLVTSIDDALNSSGAFILNGNADNIEVAMANNNDAGGIQARRALEVLKQDILSGKYRKTGKPSERVLNGSVVYQDVALGSKDYVGVTVNLSEEFLKEHKGKKNSPTFADAVGETVTMYIPKSDAKNDFTESVRWKPNDIILKHQPIVREIKGGGKFTIGQETDKGFLTTVELDTWYLDEATKKPQRSTKVISRAYPSDTGGDNLVKGISAWVNSMAQANSDWLEGKQPKIFNVNELPSVKEMTQNNKTPQNVVDIFQQKLYSNQL